MDIVRASTAIHEEVCAQMLLWWKRLCEACRQADDFQATALHKWVSEDPSLVRMIGADPNAPQHRLSLLQYAAQEGRVAAVQVSTLELEVDTA